MEEENTQRQIKEAADQFSKVLLDSYRAHPDHIVGSAEQTTPEDSGDQLTWEFWDRVIKNLKAELGDEASAALLGPKVEGARLAQEVVIKIGDETITVGEGDSESEIDEEQADDTVQDDSGTTGGDEEYGTPTADRPAVRSWAEFVGPM